MIKKICCAVCLFLMSACFGGYSPESKFYTLKSVENVTPLSEKTFSIGIDLPELPEYADRPQIVSFSPDGAELNIDEANRWGEDLDIMLQRVIAEDLRACLPKAGIKARTSLLEKYSYLLDVSVVKFELVENKGAYFEALWVVKNGSSFNVAHKGKTSLFIPTDNDYNEYVTAMNKMIGQMCEQIARKIAKN